MPYYCLTAKFDLLTPPTNWKTSLFYIYAVLTLCKISKTSGVQILRYQRYGRTDRQMDGRVKLKIITKILHLKLVIM